jgi:nucleoside-diphosphate-sugar epimerase
MTSTQLVIGCGYLGQRVATLWQERGDRVHATTRRPEGADALRRLGLAPILCDVLDPASLRALPKVDAVCYAVGLDRSSGASMRSVYVDGLANVLEHLPPPRRFLYVSSSSVYGQTDGGWVDESSATEPEEESGRIVLAAEEVLRQRRPEAVILRFSGIYGPGRLLRRKSIEAGEPIVADADKWLNLIHVDDGARAVLAAEAHAVPGGIYNICDDHPVPRREFYTELARVLGAPPPRFVTPPPDQPAPPHEKANRRIGNRRMKDELGVVLAYPDYRRGLLTCSQCTTGSSGP